MPLPDCHFIFTNFNGLTADQKQRVPEKSFKTATEFLDYRNRAAEASKPSNNDAPHAKSYLGGLVSKASVKRYHVLQRANDPATSSLSRTHTPTNMEMPPLSPTTLLPPEQFIHPWRRITLGHSPDTVFALARRNYKVHADLGATDRTFQRYTAIIDNGAGTSFIRRSEVPKGATQRVVPLESPASVRDANNRPLPVLGSVRL